LKNPIARRSPLPLLAAVSIAAAIRWTGSAGAAGMQSQTRFFLPDAADSAIVSVKASGSAVAKIVIVTEAVAVKENAPAATVKRFGEVYSFSPSTIFVVENQPTQIALWNLQSDDEHDLSIIGPDGRPLMDLRLAPLSITSYVFTFHQRGLLTFRCLIHQPAMSGQIVVAPPGDAE